MSNYNKITALYSRLSVGDEDRDGGESNSIQNQKIFLENYAKGQHLTNIRHYIDDDESGRFFDRSAYSRMIEDVESGKIGVCIMKDLTRWGRDYLQVGNAMEIFRRNNVRFIAVNNGIDSENPDTLEFAPFINIMSEWYAKDISKKVRQNLTDLTKVSGNMDKRITNTPYCRNEVSSGRVESATVCAIIATTPFETKPSPGQTRGKPSHDTDQQKAKVERGANAGARLCIDHFDGGCAAHAAHGEQERPRHLLSRRPVYGRLCDLCDGACGF